MQKHQVIHETRAGKWGGGFLSRAAILTPVRHDVSAAAGGSTETKEG